MTDGKNQKLTLWMPIWFRIIWIVIILSVPTLLSIILVYIVLNGGIYINEVYVAAPEKIIENILWNYFGWGVITCPAIPFIVSMCPMYYKKPDGFYYIKLYRKRKITDDTIKYIRKDNRYTAYNVLSTSYIIRMKREIFALRINISERNDFPFFARDILKEFPVEDYPKKTGIGWGSDIA